MIPAAAAPRIIRRKRPYTLYRPVYTYYGRRRTCPNWRARLSVTGPDGRSRQIRVNLRTPDLAQAHEKASAVYLEHSKRQAAVASIQLRPLLTEYRRHLEATKAPKTAQNEWYTLRNAVSAIVPFLETATLDDITTNAISIHLDERRTDEGIAPKTAHHIRTALGNLFKYAREKKGYGHNPVAGVERPRVRPGPIEYLSIEEITDLLARLGPADPLLHPIVATGIFAGLRRSELIWLTWADVDLDKRSIRIRPKVAGSVRYSPKTDLSRSVPISDHLDPILRPLPRTGRWVFPSPKGLRWNPDNLSARLRRFMRSIGREGGFNLFRHTFASQLAQKGLSLYQISSLLGNSEEVCRRHYAALANDRMRPDISFMAD